MVQAQFVQELGTFDLKKDAIKTYFSDQKIDYFSIKESFNDTDYKINFQKQFQIKDWFNYDWFGLQQHFDFYPERFLTYYASETHNEAKQKYYGELNFSRKKMYHEQELSFFKEWGGLNHPPIQEKISDLSTYSKNYAPIDYNTMNSAFFESEFNQNIDQMTDSELSFGNELQILEDKHSYLKKMELIKNAKTSILMSSLVFVCDSSTYELTKELIKKSKAGVPVYVIVDKFVSTMLFHHSCPNQMKRNGIKLIKANDFFRYEGNAIYHSKKLIVDLGQAIIGGQNMLNADNLSNGTDFRNRDIDILVKGPLVNDMANGFIQDFEHFLKKRKYRKFKTSFSIENIKKENLAKLENQKMVKSRGQENYSEILSQTDTRMNGVCRFVQQSPYKDRTVIGKAYLEYLNNTQSYLGIQTPQMLDTKYTRFGQKPLIETFDEFGMYNLLQDKILALGDNPNMKIDLISSGSNVAGNEVVDMLNEKIRKKLEAGKIRNANRKSKQIVFWNNHYGKPHFAHLIKDFVPKKSIEVWNHISFIHSKIFYFDRIVASIGSYNLHHNATDHAYENTIICQDKNLNHQLDEVMVRDMANSVPFVFKNLVK